MRLPAALLCLLSLPVCGAVAQTASDPARKTNGLGEDTKPWHVHATYQTFDEQGKPSGTGTFEMWWASATKYKEDYVSESFKQTVYGTESKPVRVGYPSNTPYPEAFLESEIVHPVPNHAEVSEARLDPRDLTLGTLKLHCTMLWQHFNRDAFPPLGLYPTYCSGDKPVLRLSLENSTNQISRNQLVLFRDEYLARQISITDRDQSLMQITVDQIETLKDVPDSFFTPPPEAISLNSRPVIDGKSMPGFSLGHLVSSADPIYRAMQNRTA